MTLYDITYLGSADLGPGLLFFLCTRLGLAVDQETSFLVNDGLTLNCQLIKQLDTRVRSKCLHMLKSENYQRSDTQFFKAICCMFGHYWLCFLKIMILQEKVFKFDSGSGGWLTSSLNNR